MQDSQASLSTKTNKTDALVQQFYGKVAQIIVQSRVSSSSISKQKTNKWFNLELPEHERLKEQLKFWKGQLSSTAQAPPLIIDIFLDISQLDNQALVLKHHANGTRFKIPPEQLIGQDSIGRSITKQRILLETWQLTLSYLYLILVTPYLINHLIYLQCTKKQLFSLDHYIVW